MVIQQLGEVLGVEQPFPRGSHQVAGPHDDGPPVEAPVGPGDGHHHDGRGLVFVLLPDHEQSDDQKKYDPGNGDVPPVRVPESDVMAQGHPEL